MRRHLLVALPGVGDAVVSIASAALDIEHQVAGPPASYVALVAAANVGAISLAVRARVDWIVVT